MKVKEINEFKEFHDKLKKEYENLRKLKVAKKDTSKTLQTCSLPENNNGIEYEIDFRDIKPDWQIIDIEKINNKPKLGTNQITEGGLYYIKSFIYKQRWNFLNSEIGDLASTLALAPGEKVQISVKNIQKSSIHRDFVESNESTSSYDQTSLDKDIINVTKTSTKSSSWNVSSDLSLSIGPISLGASGGYSQSESSTINQGIEHISEVTQKSSQLIKTSNKVEVKQTYERTDETEHTRTFSNPYNDRSLLLNVFEMNKKYHVETFLDEIQTCLMIEIRNIKFDNEFIHSNIDFLSSYLLDSVLLNQLINVARVDQYPIDKNYPEKTRTLAKICLEYLFSDEINLFKFEESIQNIVSNSFDASLPNSGFVDSYKYGFGKPFSALAIYYDLFKKYIFTGVMDSSNYYNGNGYEKDESLYNQPGVIINNSIVEFAISLAKYCESNLALLTDDQSKKLFDTVNLTEIYRRIHGFIAITNNLLEPKINNELSNIEYTNKVQESLIILERIIKHMNSYRDYYVAKYVKYIYNKAGKPTVIQFFENLINSSNSPELLQWYKEVFSLKDLILDGTKIIIPFKIKLPSDSYNIYLGEKDPFQIDKYYTSTNITLPLDGSYIEAVPGNCILKDAPLNQDKVNFSLELKKE